MLPFTREQFFDVFSIYNQAIWPVQIAGYGLGLAAVVAILMGRKEAPMLISVVLAIMWAWTGIAYHFVFFSAINGTASLFAAVFVMQALVFVHHGVRRRQLVPATWPGWHGAFGWTLIAYAAIAYPLIGLASGHALGGLPHFGVTPCPVTLFTFGLLLLMRQPLPWPVAIIPVIWSLIGGSAAFLLGVPQDWPLLVSGMVSVLIMWRARV
jgi:hypothetical protein